MKRLVMAMVVMCAANAVAMPTQAELKKAQPLVVELMAPTMAEFKAAGAKDKATAAVKVADTSTGFVCSAETEAAKFLLLKGAVSFYTRGEAYDKAADAVEALKANVKDVTPAVIAEITGKATGKISETKAPRLFALYRAARLQVRAENEAKTLAQKLKKVKSDALQRRYAEALAISGDWEAAYAEFAKLSDAKLKAVAEAEASGTAKNAESGEFWWAYEPAMEDAGEIFKTHAVAFYRLALAADEITGLKKNIVEQRIKPYGDAVEVAVAKSAEPKRLTYSGYLPRVNTQLWDGVSVDDIQSFEATFAGRTVGQSGRATGYVVKSGKGWKFVQFQYVDGVKHLKCVYARFEQKGGTVRGYAEKAMFASSSIAIGTDFATIESAQEMPALALADDQGGYGIKDLVVTVGGRSAAAMPAATTTTGSIELKTGGNSPFTVKGNDATLELKNGAKLEFVKCPSGWVKVVDDYENKMVRKVEITRPFWIMKQGLRNDDVIGSALEKWGTHHGFIEPNQEDRDKFCSDLTDELKGVLPKGYVVRPPSLVEWEYAYHAGDEDPGSEPFGSLLKFHDWSTFDTHKGTSPVNKWGLHDFHVAEQVFDRVDNSGRAAVKVNKKDKKNISKLPDAQSDKDVFFWSDDHDSASYLVRWPTGCALELKPKNSRTGFVRLVIGPDLVSEWKAKHGKK